MFRLLYYYHLCVSLIPQIAKLNVFPYINIYVYIYEFTGSSGFLLRCGHEHVLLFLLLTHNLWRR